MASRTRPRKLSRPEFTVARILAWADSYHARTGKWPQSESGPLPDPPRETWRRVDNAPRCGLGGRRGGSSLARLLPERRNVRTGGGLPPLRQKQVLAWSDAHHRRTQAWPTA